MKNMYVYIMSNKTNSVLYIGVTNNLVRRVWEHKNKIVKGFTSRYNVCKLLYYEAFEDELMAIAREKELKHFKRVWKEDLINKANPERIDLYDEICQ